MMEKASLKPGEQFDLSRLECVIAAGAPSTPETFAELYRSIKQDLWVTSQSGGTEICTGFVGASPTLPVYAGEIQTRMLGMDVHAWSNDGKELVDEVGELVVTSPFPSMPIGSGTTQRANAITNPTLILFPACGGTAIFSRSMRGEVATSTGALTRHSIATVSGSALLRSIARWSRSLKSLTA
jgi:hypothetical protein